MPQGQSPQAPPQAPPSQGPADLVSAVHTGLAKIVEHLSDSGNEEGAQEMSQVMQAFQAVAEKIGGGGESDGPGPMKGRAPMSGGADTQQVV